MNSLAFSARNIGLMTGSITSLGVVGLASANETIDATNEDSFQIIPPSNRILFSADKNKPGGGGVIRRSEIKSKQGLKTPADHIRNEAASEMRRAIFQLARMLNEEPLDRLGIGRVEIVLGQFLQLAELHPEKIDTSMLNSLVSAEPFVSQAMKHGLFEYILTTLRPIIGQKFTPEEYDQFVLSCLEKEGVQWLPTVLLDKNLIVLSEQYFSALSLKAKQAVLEGIRSPNRDYALNCFYLAIQNRMWGVHQIAHNILRDTPMDKEREDWYLILAAMKACKTGRHSDNVNVLLEMLEKFRDDPYVTSDVLDALDTYPWTVVVDPLQQMIKYKLEKIVSMRMFLDEDAYIVLKRMEFSNVGKAIELLGSFENETLYDYFLSFLGNSDFGVRMRAISALAKLRDPRAIEHIAKHVFRDAREHKPYSTVVSEQVIRALFLFSGPEIRVALIKIRGEIEAASAGTFRRSQALRIVEDINEKLRALKMDRNSDDLVESRIVERENLLTAEVPHPSIEGATVVEEYPHYSRQIDALVGLLHWKLSSDLQNKKSVGEVLSSFRNMFSELRDRPDSLTTDTLLILVEGDDFVGKAIEGGIFSEILACSAPFVRERLTQKEFDEFFVKTLDRLGGERVSDVSLEQNLQVLRDLYFSGLSDEVKAVVTSQIAPEGSKEGA